MKKFAIWNNGEVIGYADMTQEAAEVINGKAGVGIYIGIDRNTDPQEYGVEPSKDFLVGQLELLLKRACSEIVSIELISNSKVEVLYKGGYLRIVNIEGNSPLAIIKDVVKNIKY